jgi:hypothetical protein
MRVFTPLPMARNLTPFGMTSPIVRFLTPFGMTPAIRGIKRRLVGGFAANQPIPSLTRRERVIPSIARNLNPFGMTTPIKGKQKDIIPGIARNLNKINKES